MPKDLTIRQRRFVQAMVDPTTKSASEAAIKAGYSEKGAGVEATRALRNATVRTALVEAMREAGIDEARLSGVMSAGLDIKDPNARHKYLETILKVRGDFAPEKHQVETVSIVAMVQKAVLEGKEGK
jgi:hypothetical protein